MLEVTGEKLFGQNKKIRRANYEFTLLPYAEVDRYTGTGWPRSMAFPAMMSALKLFLGLEEKKTGKGRQINNDEEYILQAAITTESFRFSSSPPIPLEDSFLLYGYTYETLKKREYGEAEIVHLAFEEIRKGYPVIIQPESYSDMILALGFSYEGETLRGLGFLDGDDKKNSAVCFNHLKEYTDWYKEDCTILKIRPSDCRISKKEAAVRALRRGCELITNSRTEQTNPLRGHGTDIYLNWIYLLEKDNGVRNAKIDHMFPYIFILYENKMRLMEFLQMCRVLVPDMNAEILEEAIADYDSICNRSKHIIRIFMNEEMEDRKVNEKRTEIIRLLYECKEKEEQAVNCLRTEL
ncbi:MAG: hypothetical protein E7256_09480 [Lachnospiraceae bacterium]|nr:hypothetical protein [Lachnospiraceae bacterium]